MAALLTIKGLGFCALVQYLSLSMSISLSIRWSCDQVILRSFIAAQ